MVADAEGGAARTCGPSFFLGVESRGIFSTADCTGRAGRILHCVVGSASLPDLPFVAPGAPEFHCDNSVVLTRRGPNFWLSHGDARILIGTATVTPYSLEVDVGGAEILNFGAATGGPDGITPASAS